MSTQIQHSFKKFFILEFTKELLRSTESYRNLLINQEVKEILSENPEEKSNLWSPEKQRREELKSSIKKIIHQKIKQETQLLTNLKKESSLPEFTPLFLKEKPRKKPNLKLQKRALASLPRIKIPEPALPGTVSDIRPFPSFEELHLGKLDPLVRDPLVKTIECNGPNKKLIVTGAMGRKSTAIVLNEDEVDSVIQTFSQATKIPVSEGIFRVVYGKLSLSAVVSEIVGSRFIIKKMALPPLRVPLQRNI